MRIALIPFRDGIVKRRLVYVGAAAVLALGCSGTEPPTDALVGGSAGIGGVAASGTGGAVGGRSGVGGRTNGSGGVAGAIGVAGAAGTDPGAAGAIAMAGAAGRSGAGGSGGAVVAAGASGGGVAGREAGGRTGFGGRGGAPESGAGGAAGGAAGAAGLVGTGGSPPTLNKFVGNIDTRGQIRSDFVTYWNQISPENAGKWGSIEGTRNSMKWSTLDTFYAYAKEHNIPFKQHNFLWGSQQPGWIAGLSQADQRAEVEEWIRLYCERYPDTQLIDVLNEPPPHTTPPYVAALGGAGKSGYDWIAQAFTWAHQYCPNSILILNDYNNIEYANDNQHTIDIVKAIKGAGAPIHGVGAQAHACASLSASTVKGYIDKISSQTGLPVYVSEYDLNIADDNQQKNVMQSQFTMFYENPNVAGITLWGYIVGSTWETNSGLMSSSGTMRPAMTWLTDYLRN